MRGTDYLMKGEDGKTGITPAHAGNSQVSRSTRDHSKDHPRTCGEQLLFQICKFPSKGSPPHMRGTETALPPEVAEVRITPAHAGNSFCSPSLLTLP